MAFNGRYLLLTVSQDLKFCGEGSAVLTFVGAQTRNPDGSVRMLVVTDPASARLAMKSEVYA